MIKTNSNSRYSQLRVATAVIVIIAVITVVTGVAGNASVLAWAVAAIALTTLLASFYLKP
jgi:hypothetical protein